MFEKTFEKNKLRFGMLKEYNGIKNKCVEWSFKSYIVFYEEDGYYVNLLDENEKYPIIQEKKQGEVFLSVVSDTIDIIMYKISGSKERRYYFLSEIEDAILASEFYFKEKEEIIKKRQQGNLEQIKKGERNRTLRLFKRR